MPNSFSWSFEWARSWDEVWSANYVISWRNLIETARSGPVTPFIYPELVRLWLDFAGGARCVTPYFLKATSGEGATAFLPLVSVSPNRRNAWVRQLRPIGGDFFDYHDAVFSPEIACGSGAEAAFWSKLEGALQAFSERDFDTVVLPRVRTMKGLSDSRWRLSGTAPYVDLSTYASYENFIAARKRSLRANVGQTAKKLAAEGEVELKVYGKDDVEQAVAFLPRLEDARARKYPGSRFPIGYLQKLLYVGLGRGPVHCSTLRVGGRT